MGVGIPGNMAYDASSMDQQWRNASRLFVMYANYSAPTDANSGDLSDLVKRNGVGDTARICARSGNVFPDSRLVQDGQGRIVGDIFYTEGPAVPYLPPFPTFLTGE
jgi:hypothetical protein